MNNRKNINNNGNDGNFSEVQFINIGFQGLSNNREVYILLQEILLKHFSIVENNIFFLDIEKKLHSFFSISITNFLLESAKKLEESGITDWAIEKKEISIIPDLDNKEGAEANLLILIPIILRGTNYGLFIAKQNLEMPLDQVQLLELKSIAYSAAMSLDNILSYNKVAEMNERLSILYEQMIKSAKFATIGELAASFAWEIDNPLQIIKANLQLIESGVGNVKRRIEIINEQVDKISLVNQRLSNLAFSNPNDFIPIQFNLNSLVDEVLLFTNYQLQKDDIKIEKEFEENNFDILGYKPQLELVILNFILNARDSMPDGGTLTIGIFKSKTKSITLSFTDTGKGFDESELEHIFEPNFTPKLSSKNIGGWLFLAKNIIIQHNGSISVFSEVGKGSTFKILLPYTN